MFLCSVLRCLLLLLLFDCLGPHRDVIGELMQSFRSRDLHAGIYFSIFEWFHPLYLSSDPSQYVSDVSLPQMYDLINSYKPELLWCDGAWMMSSDFWHSKDFLAWLYNESPVRDVIVVNDRFGNETHLAHGGFFSPEYSDDVFTRKWEESSGINMHSYGFNRNSPLERYYVTYQSRTYIHHICYDRHIIHLTMQNTLVLFLSL